MDYNEQYRMLATTIYGELRNKIPGWKLAEKKGRLVCVERLQKCVCFSESVCDCVCC